MLSKLDESVGRVVEALRKRDMLKNSVIVFSTDNGGPPAGFNLNAASNWPLRGTKNTLWEGRAKRSRIANNSLKQRGGGEEWNDRFVWIRWRARSRFAVVAEVGASWQGEQAAVPH